MTSKEYLRTGEDEHRQGEDRRPVRYPCYGPGPVIATYPAEPPLNLPPCSLTTGVPCSPVMVGPFLVQNSDNSNVKI